MENTKSMLESFVVDDTVAELEVVDDLWYFIVGQGGAFVLGG
jgi:hypothetical protein